MEFDYRTTDLWAMLFAVLLLRITTIFTELFLPEYTVAALRSLLASAEWPIGVIIVALAATSALFMFAPLLPIDWRRYGRPIGGGVTGLLAVGLAGLYLTGTHEFNTDVQLFAAEGAKTFLAGENPYTTTFDAALERTGIVPTHRVDGSVVHTLSYPGGMVLTFVPQYLLGIEDSIELTISLFGIALFLLLLYETPGELVVVALIMLTAVSNLMYVGLIGGVGPVWIFPLLLGMYWWQRRPRASAAAFGWAAAVKQLVWPIFPFVALWVWLDSDDLGEFVRTGGRHALWGGGVFLALNLPFILMDPVAWVRGAFDPVVSTNASLVARGGGMAAITALGVYPMSTTAYAGFVALITLVLAGLYVRWWPEARWAAFVFTPLILVGHYRYLNYYFFYFMPVIFYAWVRYNQEEGVFPERTLPLVGDDGEEVAK